MILLGRGLDALAPKRRLLADLVMISFTLAMLLSLSLAFDFSAESSGVFLPVFTGGLTVVAVVRYVRAARR